MNSESSASRWGAHLALCSLLAIGIGQSMTFAILAPLAREIGLQEIQVGLIITSSSLIFTISSPAWGRRCDRWGRKPVMLIGQVGYTVGVLLFASVFFFGLKGVLSGSILYLLIISSRAFMASLTSAAPSASSAYIADITTPDQRTIGMGRLGAARNLGTILGPAVSGIFATISLLTPLYLAACTTFLNSILIAVLLKEPKKKSPPKPPHPKLKVFDRRYFPFLFVGFTAFTAFSMMTQTIGFYFQDKFVLDGKATAQAIGAGLMVTAITSLFAQVFLVRRFRMTPIGLLKVGLPILMIGYASLLFADHIIVLIGFLGILGLGQGMVAPGFTAGASLSVSSDEQGAVGGLTAACPSGGFVLGPLIGTSLYQVNHTLPYICAGILMALVFIYAFKMKIEAPKPVSAK